MRFTFSSLHLRSNFNKQLAATTDGKEKPVQGKQPGAAAHPGAVASTCSTSSSSWPSFSSSSSCSLLTLSRSSTTALQLSSLLQLPKLDISRLKALLSHLADEQRRAWAAAAAAGRRGRALPFSAARQPAEDPLDLADLPPLLSGPLFLLFVRGGLALHRPEELLLH